MMVFIIALSIFACISLLTLADDLRFNRLSKLDIFMSGVAVSCIFFAYYILLTGREQ